MIKVTQAESVGAVHTHTHTDSCLVNNVVENTTFICDVKNVSMCNVRNHNNIVYKRLE